jgi:hypothetical protein
MSQASENQLGPVFVRRDQLEALTGVPKATWATWESRPPRQGPPPTIKVGRRVLYRWPETIAWLEAEGA